MNIFMNILERLQQEFNKRYQDTGLDRGAFSAPGRVNLIGEHTDYNEGFVLPMAIEKRMITTAQLRDDRQVHAYAYDFEAEGSFSLDQLQPVSENTWQNYLMGVALELEKMGHELQGMNIVLAGNVPRSAGLSSSAALEVATAFTWASLNNLEIEPVAMALLCQRAENDFVGVNCGIMDQYISRLGQKDHALLIDCRSNQYQLVPFTSDKFRIVICNTNVQRELVDSAYNERRQQCNQAAAFFQKKLDKEVSALRDVSLDDFENFADSLSRPLKQRARHVVTENKRVLQSVEALKNDDFAAFGKLMIASHESLRDDYEVSCEELDLMVDLALAEEGVYGARMTGAGFGGCTVNLVAADKVEQFKEKVAQKYEEQTGVAADIYVSSPADGARREK